MFITKKRILFVLILALFCSGIYLLVKYYGNGSVVAISGKNITKSSKIPDKREFPINEKINPCVDFYGYACSKVIDSFQLREDRSRHVFSFSDANERLLDYKKKYFKGLAKKKPESEIELEVKNYYVACMDKGARKREELAIVSETKKKLSKIKTKEEFFNMLAKNIKSAKEVSFIDFDAQIPNNDRPKYNDLALEINLMTLPERSYYANKKLTGDLKKIFEDFFKTIGEKDPKKKADMLFGFEKALAEVYPIPPEIRERIYSRTSISKQYLIKNYPNLKLKGFLEVIPDHVNIRDIVGKDAMAFLDKKLKTMSLEDLKAICLYSQLSSIMDEAYPEYFKKKFEFNKKYLGGPNKRSDLEERCTRKVMGSFSKEIDYTLLPKIFPNFPKKKFIKSIEKVRLSLLKQLENNEWLSKDTKKEAIRKIKKAKLMLVSPDNEEEWYFNPRASYSVDAHINNAYKLGQLLMDRSLSELKGPINTDRWLMAPLTINAYHHPMYNQIVFPIGILQYPFYDPNEPEEVNLGAIGAVIGHELGHAIDDNGNKYDADGRFKPWMSKSDKIIFDKKSQYLITQFDKIGHNGKFTLGENIGDLVGLTTAYKAAFPEGKKVDKDLQRRFFLQQARLWCGVEREGLTKKRLKTDPHSLEKARTNEQVKHQKGFKEAYNCKPGDSLVISDEEMVKVW